MALSGIPNALILKNGALQLVSDKTKVDNQVMFVLYFSDYFRVYKSSRVPELRKSLQNPNLIDSRALYVNELGRLIAEATGAVLEAADIIQILEDSEQSVFLTYRYKEFASEEPSSILFV